MQLRGLDVIEQDGVQAIAITPEAGTVKTGMGRVVPLHEHILGQGFLDRGLTAQRPAVLQSIKS